MAKEDKEKTAFITPLRGVLLRLHALCLEEHMSHLSEVDA
jgi:hypothetical protein